MKKLLLLLIPLSVFISCSTEGEDPAAACLVNGVTIFDENPINHIYAPTRFVYSPDGADGYYVENIFVYENTDSSFHYTYAYNGTNLQSITVIEDGTSLVYNATYNGDNLVKLTTEGGGNNLAGEVVLVYSGNNVSSLETWVKAIDGNQYQVGHFTLTYNGSGDLTKSEINFDFVAVFTIAFGGVPDTAYAPAFFGSIEYEYGQDAAPNPIYGIYYMENPDMGFLKNMPINVIHKDNTGAVTGSDAYAITFNEFGYPIKSTSGAAYIEATYVCN